MAKLSDNAKAVINCLRANPGVDVTAKDLAETLNLPVAVVNGTVTALRPDKKNLAYREEVEGSKDKVIRLTDLGKTVDLETFGVEAEAAAE